MPGPFSLSHIPLPLPQHTPPTPSSPTGPATRRPKGPESKQANPTSTTSHSTIVESAPLGESSMQVPPWPQPHCLAAFPVMPEAKMLHFASYCSPKREGPFPSRLCVVAHAVPSLWKSSPTSLSGKVLLSFALTLFLTLPGKGEQPPSPRLYGTSSTRPHTMLQIPHTHVGSLPPPRRLPAPYFSVPKAMYVGGIHKTFLLSRWG